MHPSTPPTTWEQRRLLVAAIMDNLAQLLAQTDHQTSPRCYALRRIFDETEVTIDTIRARVATQALTDDPPVGFWPPMRARLNTFAPDLGTLVCEGLDMDPAYAAFWEPETRALMQDGGWVQPQYGAHETEKD